MGRRKPYTKLVKKNRRRGEHVLGMGDVGFRVFQCLNPDCPELLVVRQDELKGKFLVRCPRCGYEHRSGTMTVFFEFELMDLRDGSVIEKGKFAIPHRDHIGTGVVMKYCVLCNSLKAESEFDVHSARITGRQSECRLCKSIYNSLKNQTRLAAQHREAADYRRMMDAVASGGRSRRIDEDAIWKDFGGKCFNCDEPLARGSDEWVLDHTLPAKWLWPLDLGPTLLCKTCNGNKAEKWPSEYYKNQTKLRRLSVLTGIPFQTLAGKPAFNPEALKRLREGIDDFLVQWIKYPNRIAKLRRAILKQTRLDIFAKAKKVPGFLRDWEDEEVEVDVTDEESNGDTD